MRRRDAPNDEAARLEALWGLHVLDTPAEERFDRLTRLARRLFGVPIALVSLVDEHRQWFKSRDGLDFAETPRDVSFCGHAISSDALFVVPDALQDARFASNPLVLGEPHVRFYAGCPLKAPGGQRIGTLCIMDRQPRQLEDGDLEALRDLAAVVERELAAVQLATQDALTDVPNRLGFTLLAGQSLRFCRRQSAPAALVYVDLDGFKHVNDTFGHAEGDRALVLFAEQLAAAARDVDVLGRLGGDEFALLLFNATERDAERVVARLRRSLAAADREQRRGYALGFSHGVVAFDARRHRTIGDMLMQGDARMYATKRGKS
jgi:diguanylate cyclase (GGDEF)-like protein